MTQVVPLHVCGVYCNPRSTSTSAPPPWSGSENVPSPPPTKTSPLPALLLLDELLLDALLLDALLVDDVAPPTPFVLLLDALLCPPAPPLPLVLLLELEETVPPPLPLLEL